MSDYGDEYGSDEEEYPWIYVEDHYDEVVSTFLPRIPAGG